MRLRLNRLLNRFSFSIVKRRLPLDSIKKTENDAYLVSYPRSGSTWLRVLLARILYEQPVDSLIALQRFVPDIHFPHFCTPANPNIVPQVIKSHFPFRSDYGRVIYLVRDPRDVFPSYYKYLVKYEGYGGDLRSFVVSCLNGRIWPCSWQEHIHSWLDGRDDEEMPLVIRYEDIYRDSLSQLKKICSYLSFECDEVRLQAAIDYATPERIRLVANDPLFFQGSDDLNGFVTTARPLGWSEEAERSVNEMICSRLYPDMKRFGYLNKNNSLPDQ